MKKIDALGVLCVQLTRDLLAIAKFLLISLLGRFISDNKKFIPFFSPKKFAVQQS